MPCSRSINSPIPRDQWVTVDMWMKVTSTVEPSMRIWVNGVFMGEKSTNTIPLSSTLSITEMRLGDYWNIPLSFGQSFWVDDLIVYNSKAGNVPTNTDSGGRVYIGNITTGGTVDTTPPVATTSPRASAPVPRKRPTPAPRRPTVKR